MLTSLKAPFSFSLAHCPPETRYHQLTVFCLQTQWLFAELAAVINYHISSELSIETTKTTLPYSQFEEPRDVSSRVQSGQRPLPLQYAIPPHLSGNGMGHGGDPC
jgi:hypothetical protein